MRPYGYLVYGDVVPQHMYVDDVEINNDVQSPGELDFFSLGSTAISRTIPTNPSFDLAQFIGELRSDGLPRISGLTALKDRAGYLKKSGDEYLNVEFGWKPLVSDLRSFAHAVKRSHDVIRDYQKQADSRVRRRYAFPSKTSTRVYTSGDGKGGAVVPMGPNGTDLTAGLGNGVQTSTKSLDIRFSGAFRYHIPIGDSIGEKLAGWSAQADKLLGVDLTPHTVWELAPWSWAVDWFSNTGDVINNITRLGQDGLVLEWGYISAYETFTRSIQARFDTNRFYPKGISCGITLSQKSLRRRVATPYGFGFNMSTLSARQEAVVVALGLSKGTR
jgi:hypothetical protein